MVALNPQLRIPPSGALAGDGSPPFPEYLGFISQISTTDLNGESAAKTVGATTPLFFGDKRAWYCSVFYSCCSKD